MYLLLEAWTPKPAWMSLTRGEREAYVSQVASGISELEAAGIESPGWGFIDKAARGTQHVAFAVWQCPTEDAANGLRQAIADAGWYEYFDQIDFGGQVESPETVLGHHVALDVDTAAT